MQRWEYSIVSAPLEREVTLNDIGAQGWELVAVKPHHARSDWYQMFFKRPIAVHHVDLGPL